jgi:hypothetical protein
MAEQKDMKQTLLVTCLVLLSCLAYYLILKMEAMYLSEILVDFQRITWLGEFFMATAVRTSDLKSVTVNFN